MAAPSVRPYEDSDEEGGKLPALRGAAADAGAGAGPGAGDARPADGAGGAGAADTGAPPPPPHDDEQWQRSRPIGKQRRFLLCFTMYTTVMVGLHVMLHMAAYALVLKWAPRGVLVRLYASCALSFWLYNEAVNSDPGWLPTAGSAAGTTPALPHPPPPPARSGPVLWGAYAALAVGGAARRALAPILAAAPCLGPAAAARALACCSRGCGDWAAAAVDPEGTRESAEVHAREAQEARLQRNVRLYGFVPAGGQQADTCATCNAPRPRRSKHCSTCGRCVARMDHHCIWINNCVGEGNHRLFLLLLLSITLHILYGTWCLWWAWTLAPPEQAEPWPYLLLFTALLGGIQWFVLQLLVPTVSGVLRNRTVNEDLNHARYPYLSLAVDTHHPATHARGAVTTTRLYNVFDAGWAVGNCYRFWMMQHEWALDTAEFPGYIFAVPSDSHPLLRRGANPRVLEHSHGHCHGHGHGHGHGDGQEHGHGGGHGEPEGGDVERQPLVAGGGRALLPDHGALGVLRGDAGGGGGKWQRGSQSQLGAHGTLSAATGAGGDGGHNARSRAPRATADA